MTELQDREQGGGQKRVRCLAIANQKGGVGKTTTAINLATALAAEVGSVLLVDMDPQANATTGLGLDPGAPSIYEVLLGLAPVGERIRESGVPGLWVLPASADLAAAELELGEMERRAHRLSDVLAPLMEMGDGNESEGWRYILIDCPPGLGLLTLNALVAADAVVAPMQAEYFALEGLSRLMRTVDSVRERFNPQLYIDGILLTMVDRRNRLSEQVIEEIRLHFPDLLYPVDIPRNVRLAEAPSYGLPALMYDIHSSGARAYIRLTRHLLDRLDPTRNPTRNSASNSASNSSNSAHDSDKQQQEQQQEKQQERESDNGS
ncbi:MAG: ParA family protein [Alphaproteobacteria bacterium]